MAEDTGDTGDTEVGVSLLEYLDPGGPGVVDPERLQDVTPLSGFQRDLLFVLSGLTDTRPSGSDISSELVAVRSPETSHGQLYRNLRELQDKGFVARSPIDGRTYSYRPTEKARSCLRAYLKWGVDCVATGEDGETRRTGSNVCLPGSDDGHDGMDGGVEE
ncbi:hypothetical protein ACOZ4N_07165 [Halorientalis pallida]|uniref:hypothetical protein n=1 Tax=Halorientalis pallida TaxID=2479928 RepID=UPI003C701B44